MRARLLGNLEVMSDVIFGTREELEEAAKRQAAFGWAWDGVFHRRTTVNGTVLAIVLVSIVVVQATQDSPRMAITVVNAARA
jgi:hypothetical protein